MVVYDVSSVVSKNRNVSDVKLLLNCLNPGFLGFQGLSRECICVNIFFIWQDIRFRFGPTEYIYIDKNWSLIGTPVEYDCRYFYVSQDMCVLDWAPEQWELCGEKPVVESQHEKPLDSAASQATSGSANPQIQQQILRK